MSTISANRITIHHTAGIYIPNRIDLAAYHYLIDDEGNIYHGTHSVADNMDCTDGNYAAHCGGGNTKNIGVALCGNLGFNSKTLATRYPLTRKQLETCFKLCAELSIKYGIVVQPSKIFTHTEFDSKRKKPEGKIDIIYLPPFPFVKRSEVGDFMRNKITWYKSHHTGFTLI